MRAVASLPGPNLFSSLPAPPPPQKQKQQQQQQQQQTFSPPIPIPKYPKPPPKKPQNPQTTPDTPNPNHPALKLPHRRTKYYKPVKPGTVLSSSGDGLRSVVIGESGVSYLLPGASFEFQYSYSETPSAKPVAIREPAFLPFAPPSMARPWTGKAPLKSKKNSKIALFDSFNPPPPKKGMKAVALPGPFEFGQPPREGRTREEVLGAPLRRDEVLELIKPMLSDNRQVNLGRDGLTHNMLELVHTHWKRQRVCKVRCKGVPTVDMKNVCRHLEEKTGGRIIHSVGGVVYLFRGRNYNYRTRPRYPLMLWKPAAPVYPKLIRDAPEGLTKDEANELREKGKNLLPICKLAKNGVYINLVRDVRTAFEVSPLVKIDCKGMHASDYKKLGAKLKDLVPSVLLSFDDEQILMWRGQNWKSMWKKAPLLPIQSEVLTANGSNESAGGNSDGDCDNLATPSVRSSPKMMSLWNRAIESSKAVVLDDLNLGPDDLLRKVEDFESASLAMEHSYTALIQSSEAGFHNVIPVFEDSPFDETFSGGDMDQEDEYDDEDDDEDGYYDSDSFQGVDSIVPLGSLPVDRIAERLKDKRRGVK